MFAMLLTEASLAERQEEPARDREAEHRLIRAAASDPKAVALLYRQHHEAIARYVLRRVGQSGIAEDLVADVFLSMVRYLPRYRIGETPFRAWLYRLATNRVNRWARWRRWRVFRQLQDVPARESPDRESDLSGVRAALLTLPVRFQSVLSLHYLEEMSIQRVAEVLGCAEGTVKSRLCRGRKMLRELLNESDGES